MKAITIHDAKTNLSKYIHAAKQGEQIYIGSFGKAEVQLIKISPQEKGINAKRSFSIAKGKITAKHDAFSDPTEQEIAKLMLGNIE
ncbi:MAG: type II toxin-antitoxin system Phd/YefM family antitoxin [Candidatus Levyibacteriota bacterium]